MSSVKTSVVDGPSSGAMSYLRRVGDTRECFIGLEGPTSASTVDKPELVTTDGDASAPGPGDAVGDEQMFKLPNFDPLLHKFAVYESVTMIYVVGYNQGRTRYRLLCIDRLDGRRLVISDDGEDYTKER